MSTWQPSEGPRRAWSAAVRIGLILGFVIATVVIVWALLAG